MRFFNRIESLLNETLAVVLFGAAAEMEYEDIPLPSERKKEERSTESAKTASRKKKGFRGFRLGGQLKLFMLRAAKKLLLAVITSTEKLVLNFSKRHANVGFENTYK